MKGFISGLEEDKDVGGVEGGGDAGGVWLRETKEGESGC